MTKGLLDLMLDESTEAAAKRPQHEEREENISLYPEKDTDDGTGRPSLWPDDVEQILELADSEVRVLLGAVAPNDLLAVIAEGSKALKNRLLGQLDPESVAWMKGNIELWDPATDALKSASRLALLKVVQELVLEGKLTVPKSSESESVHQDDVGDAIQGELGQVLAQLVALAHGEGRQSLESVVNDVAHPMLHFGLMCLVEGKEGASLERALGNRQRSLEAAYASELELIRQAMLAIERGEDVKSFVTKAKLANQ